ncbi:F-box protein At5g03100-like isoform X1 [Nicotiana sylvestris]|uniref:F-box protein At5g03100-like isoform X1 n=1 Tax=Nicotiana sylvestris TaxID=4096 RepID=UPI00388C6377
MEMQRKITAREDRLSNLPDEILIHILSMLPRWHNKEVVRSSVLSRRWRFLWKSVPISLDFDFPIRESENDNLLYLASIHRELYYWRNCEKIQKFRVWRLRYEDRFAKDIDLWVHFAIKVANVESFALGIIDTNHQRYEFPQFAYKNASLSYLALWYCQLNPTGSVNWSNLVSLSLGSLPLTDGVMEKVLSGCPNLECLELDSVSGIHRLEISSVKLTKLTIRNYLSENPDLWLEILAPYIQNLQLSGYCINICIRQRNVASLVTAALHLIFDFGNHDLEKEGSYLKELLHGIAHVENLELGPWCIEFLSVLELKGWQPPPSNWKFLELPALQQLDLPGLCSFLPCSLDLEALVIDWRYNDEERLGQHLNFEKKARRSLAEHAIEKRTGESSILKYHVSSQKVLTGRLLLLIIGGGCTQLKNQPHHCFSVIVCHPDFFTLNKVFNLFNNRFIVPRRFCNSRQHKTISESQLPPKCF